MMQDELDHEEYCIQDDARFRGRSMHMLLLLVRHEIDKVYIIVRNPIEHVNEIV